VSPDRTIIPPRKRGKSFLSIITDINPFDNCSVSQKDYIIGMLFGDGCLSQQKGKSQRITIALKDLELIEKLHPIFGVQRKIYINSSRKETHSNSYAIINLNEDFINELLLLGFHKNKSKTIELPTSIISPPDFIRGYFDANGCIYKNQVNNITYHHISFTTGSLKFANDLQLLLIENGFNPKRKIDNRHSAYYVMIYAKKEVLRFRNFIYYNPHETLFMARKKEIFDDIV